MFCASLQPSTPSSLGTWPLFVSRSRPPLLHRTARRPSTLGLYNSTPKHNPTYKLNNSSNRRPEVLTLLYACFWMYILWTTYNNRPPALPYRRGTFTLLVKVQRSIPCCTSVSQPRSNDPMRDVPCAPWVESGHLHVRGPLIGIGAIRRYCFRQVLECTSGWERETEGGTGTEPHSQPDKLR